MKLHTLLLCASIATAFAESRIPGDEHFRVETVVAGLVDAMGIAMDPEGRIFIAERTGTLKLFDPATGELEVLAVLEVATRRDGCARESGLLGVAVDPDFANNSWIYVFYLGWRGAQAASFAL